MQCLLFTNCEEALTDSHSKVPRPFQSRTSTQHSDATHNRCRAPPMTCALIRHLPVTPERMRWAASDGQLVTDPIHALSASPDYEPLEPSAVFPFARAHALSAHPLCTPDCVLSSSPLPSSFCALLANFLSIPSAYHLASKSHGALQVLLRWAQRKKDIAQFSQVDRQVL